MLYIFHNSSVSEQLLYTDYSTDKHNPLSSEFIFYHAILVCVLYATSLTITSLERKTVLLDNINTKTYLHISVAFYVCMNMYEPHHSNKIGYVKSPLHRMYYGCVFWGMYIPKLLLYYKHNSDCWLCFYFCWTWLTS